MRRLIKQIQNQISGLKKDEAECKTELSELFKRNQGAAAAYETISQHMKWCAEFLNLISNTKVSFDELSRFGEMNDKFQASEKAIALAHIYKFEEIVPVLQNLAKKG